MLAHLGWHGGFHGCVCQCGSRCHTWLQPQAQLVHLLVSVHLHKGEKLCFSPLWFGRASFPNAALTLTVGWRKAHAATSFHHETESHQQLHPLEPGMAWPPASSAVVWASFSVHRSNQAGGSECEMTTHTSTHGSASRASLSVIFHLPSVSVSPRVGHLYVQSVWQGRLDGDTQTEVKLVFMESKVSRFCLRGCVTLMLSFCNLNWTVLWSPHRFDQTDKSCFENVWPGRAVPFYWKYRNKLGETWGENGTNYPVVSPKPKEKKSSEQVSRRIA